MTPTTKTTGTHAAPQPIDGAAANECRPLAVLVRVPFHEGELLAVADPVDQEGDRPVPLRPFCERLGLTMQSQLTKLKDKPWTCVTMIVTQMPGDDQARAVACLPLRALPMWLATINASKVAPDARPMLEAYQREAADVLYRHFLGTPAPRPAIPAEVLDEMADLRARVRVLSSLPAPQPPQHFGGVIGKQEASLHIRGPLRALSRHLATSQGRKVRSMRLELETELRRRVGFPQGAGASWDMASPGVLAAVTATICAWQHRWRKEIRAAKLADRGKQLDLSESPVAVRKATLRLVPKPPAKKKPAAS